MFTSKHLGVKYLPQKTVSIRGLDTELYHEIFSIAKRSGKRVADLMNLALKQFLEVKTKEYGLKKVDPIDENCFVLRNNGEITLSKMDIIILQKKVGNFKIENTGHLVFEKDVDEEALNYINGLVIRSGIVEAPHTIYPHLLIKSEINGKLLKY